MVYTYRIMDDDEIQTLRAIAAGRPMKRTKGCTTCGNPDTHGWMVKGDTTTVCRPCRKHNRVYYCSDPDCRGKNGQPLLAQRIIRGVPRCSTCTKKGAVPRGTRQTGHGSRADRASHSGPEGRERMVGTPRSDDDPDEDDPTPTDKPPVTVEESCRVCHSSTLSFGSCVLCGASQH
jgi:hypothetical protein